MMRTATLLYPTTPHLSRQRLAQELATMPWAAGMQPEGADMLLSSAQQVLSLDDKDTPLGADAFCGALPANTPPATRAALMGIISRHRAHVCLRVEDGALPDREGDAQARCALRLLLGATRLLAATHPPLALLWGPTGQLMQGAALTSFATEADPFALYLTARDECRGPRRLPGLEISGTPPWIGQNLHAQLGALPRDVVRRAALAFVAAAHADPALLQARSFSHGAQDYRIAHAPDAARIDLIPIGATQGLPADAA